MICFFRANLHKIISRFVGSSPSASDHKTMRIRMEDDSVTKRCVTLTISQLGENSLSREVGVRERDEVITAGGLFKKWMLGDIIHCNYKIVDIGEDVMN